MATRFERQCSFLLSKEETKQREEAEDVDIKGEKLLFSEPQLVLVKKTIYDDLFTSKMLAQGKPSEMHLRHAKDMALKEYDGMYYNVVQFYIYRL
jgi:hypothetical protein